MATYAELLFQKGVKLVKSGAEYEDMMDFFTFEVLTQSQEIREEVIQSWLALLNVPADEADTDSEELEDYALLLLEEVAYEPAVPTLITRFQEAERKQWPNGFGDRAILYRVLQKIGGEDVIRFLSEKVKKEPNQNLKKNLENYLADQM